MSILPTNQYKYSVKHLVNHIPLAINKETSVIYFRDITVATQLANSTDWGETFTNVYNFVSRIERFDTLSATEMIAILQDKTVWRSSDNGETFIKVFTMFGSLGQWGGLDIYDNFVLIAPYTGDGDETRYIYMSNDYGLTFKEILHVLDDKVTHPHSVVFDPYECIIWTVWGDHRPADTIMISDDFGKTWQSLPPKMYYRCTNIMPLPNCVLFGTDEKNWFGTYRHDRPEIGTSQSKIMPKIHWAGRKDSQDPAPSTWATKPTVIYGDENNAIAYWGYRQPQIGIVPAQIYACKGDKVHPIWCQEKITDGTSGNGIEATWIDNSGNLIADFRSTYMVGEVSTTYNLLRIQLT